MKDAVISCTVCEQPTASPYKSGVSSVYSRKRYDVAHCSNCGHYFTSPPPIQRELDGIYSTNYSYDAHKLIEGEKRMRAQNYASSIAKMEGPKTALEVGCMHGLLLTELQKQGLRVSGVELDSEAVAYCQAQGLDVVQSSIEDHLDKAGDQHDVIIMSHVIEHIADPGKQLASLHKRMSANGRIVLITPNSMAPTRRLFGRYWGYWQVPVHINHFNESSIGELLKRSGFEVTDTKYYGGDSLFFLSSLANLLGSSNDAKHLSASKKALVRMATVIVRPWYWLGKEDMLVVARQAKT